MQMYMKNKDHCKTIFSSHCHANKYGDKDVTCFLKFPSETCDMKLPLYFSHILQPLYHTHLTFFCMFCKIEKKINFIISIFFFVRFCKWFVLDHSVWFPAGFASLFTHQFDMFRVKCGYPLTCTQTHAQ